jgi:hypothetical protein
MATVTNALNVYLTDQGTAATFSLGLASATYPSVYDANVTSTAGDQCQALGLLSLNASNGQYWQCSGSSYSRTVNGTGWIPVNFQSISSGAPIGSLPVDPTNQTSSGQFYSYNTNGAQFEVTANLESQKYKTQYAATPQTSLFPEVISGGTPNVSALYSSSGLVGYWNFDEGAGSSTIDQSGNGNAGTWNGTPVGTNGTYYTAGKVGSYSGTFDGSSSYVTVPHSAVLNPPAMTVLLWMNLTTWNIAWQAVMTERTSNACQSGWGIFRSNATQGLQIQVCDSAGVGHNGTIKNSFPTGSWHNVGFTADGAVLTTYYDGVAMGTSTFSGAVATTTSALLIGNDSIATSRYFNGLIDDARVYNRALSAAEVQSLYNAEK